MLRGGHVTGGVDIWCRRAQRRIDRHAVVDGEPGRLRQVKCRPDPDPDDDRVGINFVAGGIDQRESAAAARPELLDPGAQSKVDIVFAMQVGENPRNIVT